MLVVLGEFTHRCLAIVVARRLRSDDVLHCLADLFVTHGPPEHIRSDNGPEFVAINVREWRSAPSSNDKEDRPDVSFFVEKRRALCFNDLSVSCATGAKHKTGS